MTKFCTNEPRLLIRVRWTRKKPFFLLFEIILPIFESFRVSPKILIFEILYFLSKKFFFSKKWIKQILENFMGSSNNIAEKKNLSRSGVIFDGKVLKKTENPKYLRKYWVLWGSWKIITILLYWNFTILKSRTGWTFKYVRVINWQNSTMYTNIFSSHLFDIIVSHSFLLKKRGKFKINFFWTTIICFTMVYK